MKRYIKTAEEISIEDKLADLLDTIKDNFNFAIFSIPSIAKLKLVLRSFQIIARHFQSPPQGRLPDLLRQMPWEGSFQ